MAQHVLLLQSTRVQLPVTIWGLPVTLGPGNLIASSDLWRHPYIFGMHSFRQTHILINKKKINLKIWIKMEWYYS